MGMKKHKWIYWIKLFAGLGLLYVVYSKINSRDSILAAFRATGWRYIAWCAALLLPNIALAFVKWRYLLKNRFSGIRNRQVFGSLLFGYTLGLVTPGRLGELGRGLFFQDRDRVVITGLAVLDKLANQLIIFTLGSLSLGAMILSRDLFQLSSRLPLLLITALLLLGAWSIMLNPGLVRRLLRRLQERYPQMPRLASLASAFDNISFKDALAVFALTLLWFLVIVLQYHVLVLALNRPAFGESLQAVSAMLFIKTLLPFTFGELGIREALAVYFYDPFGVSEAAVFNAAIIVFLINFLLPALAGIYYVFRVREVKKASRNADAAVKPADTSGEAWQNF